MVVRRPGWLLCREVWSEIPMCVKRTAYLSLMLLILSFLVPLGGCWAVLSELPAAGPWSSPHCGGERKPRQGAGLLQKILFGESLRGSEDLMLLLYAMFWDIQRKKEGFIIKANKLYIHSHRKTSMAHKWGGCVSPCFCASVCGGTSGGPIYRRGFWGNLRGEGLVLGGVFVIGPGDQVEHKWSLKKYLIASVSGYFHWLWLIIFLLPGYSTGAPGEGIWG